MEYVIVTVKRADDARVYDIMLPVHMAVGELASILAEKLNWDRDANNQLISYEIVADPPGRLLREDETLAQAGAWDGSWLVFHVKGTVAQSERRLPVLRWLGLQKVAPESTALPRLSSGEPLEPGDQDDQPMRLADTSAPQYIFKRIDEDT